MQQKLAKMQQEMESAQKNVEESSFSASVGGGAGAGHRVRQEAADGPDHPARRRGSGGRGDAAGSGDLRRQRGSAQAEEAMESAMGALTGGLNIPGLF